MSSNKNNFDVIHKVASEYFLQIWSNKEISFTRFIETKNGFNVAYMFLDYGFSNPIDVHAEMTTINNILKKMMLKICGGKSLLK